MSVDAHALATWIAAAEGVAVADVRVEHLRRIESVGNAREPWRCTVTIDRAAEAAGAEGKPGGEDKPAGEGRPAGEAAPRVVDAVLLVQAGAGQLETDPATEMAALRAVQGTGVPAPAPLWLDASGDAFGRPFLATSARPGVADMGVLRRAPDDTGARGLVLHLAEVAARLHTVDPAGVDPRALPAVTAAEAATAQLDVWEPIAVRQLLEPMPALRWAFGWLRANAPVAERVSLVHGDLRVGNFLAAGDRVTALLDWEMAHLGDPLEDLAWTYRALWSPARVLPFDEFLARWAACSGLTVDPVRLCWYRMCNEVKHAVISLTAGRSFHDRRTTNLRLADRNLTVAPFLATFFTLLHEHESLGGQP